MTLEERLKSFWLFQDLSLEDVGRVSGFVEEESCPAGSVLYRQGDVSEKVYLVESGQVSLRGLDSDQRSTVLWRIAGAGDLVGGRSVMNDIPRRAEARVTQSSRLLVFDADDFRTTLAMFPGVDRKLKRIRVVNRLLGMPLFSVFSEEQLFDIADLAREVTYPADQVIFSEGELADAFYVIDAGLIIEDSSDRATGTEDWPKYLTAGNFFGRHGLLHAHGRRATARAETEATLIRFDAEAFHWLVKLESGFYAGLTRPDIVAELGKLAFFGRLSTSDLIELAGYVGYGHFRPGDTLYRQGEVDPTLYIIHKGEAVVRARDEHDRERPRGYLKAGDVVGESSLFLKEPRDVTVEATAALHCFYLHRQDLDRFLDKRPDLRARIVPREEVKARRQLQRFPWMDPEERVVLLTRRHWFALLRRIWGPLVLLAATVVWWLIARDGRLGHLLQAFATFVLAVTLLWVLWRLIDYFNDYYVITTTRAAHREKVLWIRENRDEAPLDKVQNVNINQGFIGNLLGFGRLVIDTAAAFGVSRVAFDLLPDPEGVQRLIFEQVQRARAGERLEARRMIRDKLETRLGVGIKPDVPRPLLPVEVPAEPQESAPSVWRLVYNSLWHNHVWIERKSPDRVTWRKHWIRLLIKIWLPVAALLASLASLALYISIAGELGLGSMVLGVFLCLPLVGWVWWNYVDWGNDQYIVTNDRIIDTEALPLGFRSKRTETTFDKIQNVSFEVPDPIATFLNYGTVMIYTAGAEGRLDFVYVRNPRGVQAEIFRRLRAYDQSQRKALREERWADLPEWFREYDQTRRA